MLKKEDLYNTRIVTNGDVDINKEIINIADKIDFKIYDIERYFKAGQLIFSEDSWLSYSSATHPVGNYRLITIEELRAMVNQKEEPLYKFMTKISDAFRGDQLPPLEGKKFTKEEVDKLHELTEAIKRDYAVKVDKYFNEIRSRLIVEPPKTYKPGDRFMYTDDDLTKDEYILAQVGRSRAALISLRWK